VQRARRAWTARHGDESAARGDEARARGVCTSGDWARCALQAATAGSSVAHKGAGLRAGRRGVRGRDESLRRSPWPRRRAATERGLAGEKKQRDEGLRVRRRRVRRGRKNGKGERGRGGLTSAARTTTAAAGRGLDGGAMARLAAQRVRRARATLRRRRDAESGNETRRSVGGRETARRIRTVRVFWKMNSGMRGTTHARYARDVGTELGGGGGRPPRALVRAGAHTRKDAGLQRLLGEPARGAGLGCAPWRWQAARLGWGGLPCTGGGGGWRPTRGWAAQARARPGDGPSSARAHEETLARWAERGGKEGGRGGASGLAEMGQGGRLG
jgi:hypothetical protein